MAWYIYDNSLNYYIRNGFETKEAAQDYIDSHEFMSQYSYAYDVAYWEDDYAYVIADTEYSLEEHDISGPMFHMWSDAWDYLCENAVSFKNDEDWNTLIHKVRM